MAQLDKTTTIKAFGVFIKQAREKQDLRQLDIANKVGIAQPYYCNIEAGNREISMTLALNICDALGVEFNSFIQFITMKKPRVVRPTIEHGKEESTPY